MSCYSKVDINQDFNHQAKLRNKLDNRTETYINRFQALSDKIAQAQSGDINDTQRMLDKMPEESAEIISKYQEKLEKENAMIISSKNRYEINEQL